MPLCASCEERAEASCEQKRVGEAICFFLRLRAEAGEVLLWCGELGPWRFTGVAYGKQPQNSMDGGQ